MASKQDLDLEDDVLPNETRRKLTEKGQDFHIANLSREFIRMKRQVKKSQINLDCLLSDEVDVDTLSQARTNHTFLAENLYEAYDKLERALQTQEEINNLHKLYDELEIEEVNMMQLVNAQIKLLRCDGSSSISLKSNTRTRSSDRSKPSTTPSSSKKVELVAKEARLKTEMKFVDKENELRENYEEIRKREDEANLRKVKLNQESNLKKLQLQKEIEATQAEIHAIDELENSRANSQDNLSKIDLDLPQEDLTERVQAYINNHEIIVEPELNKDYGTTTEEKQSKPADSLSKLVEILSAQHSRDSLPKIEPEIFKGESTKYHVWIKSFETFIENRTTDPSERLFYLSRYLEGDAKEAVAGLLSMDSKDAYTQAKEILKKRYGDPFIMSEDFRKSIRDWPIIKANDGTSLRKFADYLKNVETAMKSVHYLNVLNDCEENKKILAKLPNYICHSWARIADNWQLGEELKGYEKPPGPGTFPPFRIFVQFLTKEARIACNPITGTYNSVRVKDEPKKPERKRHTAVLSTNTKLNEPRLCRYCKKNHDLDVCEDYLKLSLLERREFAKSKGLCHGCYGTGHIRKYCLSRRICKVCGRQHPTSLHDEEYFKTLNSPKQGDETMPKTNVISNCTDTGYSSHSLIVPAYLYHKDTPTDQQLYYVIIDEQSDASFIDTGIKDQLCLRGTEVELSLSTMFNTASIKSTKIMGLMLRGYNEDTAVPLSYAYTRDVIPASRSQIPRVETAQEWPHLTRIAGNLMPYSENIRIAVLLGRNCLRAIRPKDVILGKEDEPYAVRTGLGWGIIGITRMITAHLQDTKICHFTLKTQVKEVISPADINKMFERDFNDSRNEEKGYSQNDRKFLKILQDGIHRLDDGHYGLPLPFKDSNIQLPNNKSMVMKRTLKLQKRLIYDVRYRKHYEEFMQRMIDCGFAEIVPKNEVLLNNNQIWYIPHHGVYHSKKPNKIRIVFDCSAEYNGMSLNGTLLPGPDLTNNLLGVLCRFRQENIALMCDIEGMFHQVKVIPDHRNFLRFLWWTDGKYHDQPDEYRMTVHLFGAVSSPSCANFALKTTADEFESEFGTAASNFLRNDFYVDDGLKSVSNVQDAVTLIESTKALCFKGGFRLHKFVTNNQDVLDSIPHQDRASDTTNLNLTKEVTVERALGVYWCLEEDVFNFRIDLKDKPLTRRGILSTVGSIFDPLGLVAPFLLLGKQILQELCKGGANWDDPVPEDIRHKWEKWRTDLFLLADIKIKRCYKPENFGKIKLVELHNFSDASQTGYGQCSYLRLINEEGQIHCCLVLAKARVTPLKQISIPRLELSAALVSVRVSRILSRELEYEDLKQVYWTDSKVVLGYIGNETRRFHLFVANRVQQIKDFTTADQWHYVESSFNPADCASRGMNAKDLLDNEKWWNGPNFLWSLHQSQEDSPADYITCISQDDPEVKKALTLVTKMEEYVSLVERLKYFSSWHKMKRAIAVCLRLYSLMENKAKPFHNKKSMYVPVSVEEIQAAETLIIKGLQNEYYSEDIKLLRKGLDNQGSKPIVKRSSHLYKLSPFLDEKGLLRVGGRIQRSSLPFEARHPVIIPKKHHITSVLISYFHQKVQHQGRGITLNEIRSSGYWIINGSSSVAFHISRCVQCKKTRGTTQDQMMSELPEDRLTPAPPFTYCAVDCFGPFYIKQARKEVKRYGVIYCCMSSRAIHLETLNSMDTDSFLNSYRRFIGRRGPVRQLRSDRGSNFVGAKNELSASFNEQVRQKLLEDNCTWIPFKMNYPESSHMGGSWERPIRSVRNVLNNLLEHNGSHLDDESLRTFMVEAESIVNSRPLSVDSINDANGLSPLTPNHLLTSKTKVVLPPPGIFQKADLYVRRRWRRVQFLVDEFWCRWRKEFLQGLQVRQKWIRPRRDLASGDVVLVKSEDLSRNRWSLARVEQSVKSGDGLVRKVKLAVGDKFLDNNGVRTSSVKYLERPIHKLVLLLPVEDQ